MATAAMQADTAEQGGLRLGARVRWQGGTYRVLVLQGEEVQLGCLDEAGADARALVPVVVGADDFALLDDDLQELEKEQVTDCSGLAGLSEAELKLVRDWERHLREVDDGVPPDAEEGAVPRPGYDPGVFTVRQRLAAKAAEMKALGFKYASAGTIERRRRAYQARGVFGLIREVVPGSPWGRTDERVVRLLLAEVRAGLGESDGDASRLYERLQAAVWRDHAAEYDDLMISRATFYRLLDRLGINTASMHWPTDRRLDEANGAVPPYTPTRARRLGEQVQIDSTGLDIIAVGDDGRPVQVELTAAIDVASRTIIGAMIVPKVPGRGPRGRRLGGRATRSFDAVLMLAQALAPMPARPGWSPRALAEHSEMPYADLVACDPRLAGAAARPVIRPRMVVVDHGKIFNSEHFDDVCRLLRIKVRPARERTATDKAIVESTFNAIKRRFSQYVAGYTGSDLRRRGKHVTEGPLWSLNELQDLLNEWIALDWQQKPHDGLRSPFLPGLTISPNRMYATLVAAEGHVPLVLTPHQNRKLLPFNHLKVTDKGVRIGNRTYNSEALQEYKNRHTGIPGQGKRWQIRYSPYAPRFVWLWDHNEDDWVEAEFIHQRLVGDDWTEWTWEQATLNVMEDGGRREDQRRIAREVSALRERARRGPDPDVPQVPQLFTGPALDLEVPVPDPYEGIPDPDPATVVRAPRLPMPAADIPHAAPPAPGPPAPRPGTDTGSQADPVPAEADHGAERDGHPRMPAQPYRAGVFSLRGGAAEVFALTQPPTPHPATVLGTDGPASEDGEEP
ncbi:Mu transposase C-terminal domain-containing protein [Streptomyces sp. KS_5]|uniref:Mu transposase C-terminal domain-containing protein n=1 Tax=Streptomyces sp. KS_5 TaxID=1881018 RepID=UPI000894CE98|nr:Mu transposase C-terminal domain-containing protein [Streptomyces sp. KS_5]SEE34638.1 Mu transposase, C-terminal [Streptomyces sp. KS_5]